MKLATNLNLNEMNSGNKGTNNIHGHQSQTFSIYTQILLIPEA